MKNILTLILVLFTFIGYGAIISWDGGGDGVSWHDANNWSGNVIPTASDDARFTVSVAVVGTAAVAPLRLIIRNGANVTLNLDLSIGDGTATKHAIHFFAGGGTLTLGTGFTFDLNPPSSHHGVFLQSGTCIFNNNGTLNITTPSDGIRVPSSQVFNNMGNLSITAAVDYGIENEGDFDNAGGMITIEDSNRIGIFNKTGSTFNNSGEIEVTNPGGVTADGIRSKSTFNNTASGTITVSKANDDCIELVEGIFTNDGTIEVTAKDAAATGNNGIAVGTATTAATFINTSNNSVNANGGIGTSGRGVNVYVMGTLTNTGTMTFAGGNINNRFHTEGTTTNGLGGTIDLTDGRLRSKEGVFTNNGLIKSTRSISPASAVTTNSGTGTSINNGFFDYTGSSNFSSGSGSITDNGIDLNDPVETTIDFLMVCSEDVAEVAYEWFEGAASVGTATGAGLLTLGAGVLMNDPATLTPGGLAGVSITIENVCAAALPIELTYFKATSKEKTVMLEWQTSTELDNQYVIVERSIDNRHFVEIGKVAGAGISYEMQSYELEDKNPSVGVNYYRLRQVDFDGTATLSDVVSVAFKQNSKFDELLVSPTVIRNGEMLQVDLTQLSKEEVQLVVFNTNGQLLNSHKVLAGSRVSLPLSLLPSGMYVLRTNGASKDLVARFFVEK